MLGLLGWLGGQVGCERPAAPPPSTSEIGDQGAPTSRPLPDFMPTVAPVFIDLNFVDFYQAMLLHGLTPSEKSQRWARFYKQRWVRWTGQLAYAKPGQLLFRQLGSTRTYDVIVRLARTTEPPPPSLTIGKFYNYTGRLVRYDDAFFTTYLDQGVVFLAGPEGVPSMLAAQPTLTRKLTPPPRVVPFSDEPATPATKEP